MLEPLAFDEYFWRSLPEVDRYVAQEVLNATIHLNRATGVQLTPQYLEEFVARARLRERKITFSGDRLYLRRFAIDGWMPRDPDGKLYSVYLHNIVLADEDEALHNHPWEWAESLILCGGYSEEYSTEVGGKKHPMGYEALHRNSLGHTDYHRIRAVSKGTWTLFVCGPKTASWGFDVDGVHVPWRERLDQRGITPEY